MPLYLCRWPNGDCSVVQAQSEQDAILKLDEVANPEGCPLIPLQEFQVHFHLTDDGQLELESLGEATDDAIWEFSYPALDEVKGEVQEERDASGNDTLTPEQATRVRDAVRVRSGSGFMLRRSLNPRRRWGDIKKQIGAPTVLVDQIVRQGGEETLRKLKLSRKPR